LPGVEVVVQKDEFDSAGEAQRRKLRAYAKRLREEPFLGDRIPRDRIPKSLRTLPNLFRLELPDGWRALYTVAGSPVAGTQVRVVWIGDHTRYNRLFGYR